MDETELVEKWGKGNKRGQWILLILISIYAVLYIMVSWDDFLSINSWSIEYSALKILFAIFVIGYVISWKNELAAGVVFILWFLGMCYENFFLCPGGITGRDCGDGIAMGIPLLILSIFFIVYGTRKGR
jgi:hypothetical protein